MRVSKKRWGEVIIRKQAGSKNSFDKSKSFSVSNEGYNYSTDELREIFKSVTNLTNNIPFKKLKQKISKLEVDYSDR